MRSLTRLFGVFSAALLLMLFVQPAVTSAQGTYSSYKDISNGFSCATPPADLTTISYSTTTAIATPGQCVAIRVGLINNTGATVTGLTLSDTLPTGLTGCAYAQGATSANCPAPGTSNTGCFFQGANPDVVCTVSPSGLAVSTTTGYTCVSSGNTTAPGCYEIFVAQVAANACGTITNTGTATVTSPTGSTSTTPNGANATLTVGSCTTSTVGVSKTVEVNGVPYAATSTGPAPAHPGDTLTYSVTVTNNTGAAVSNLTVTDTLQSGQAALIPNGYTQCSFTAPTYTCTAATLGNGSSMTFVMYAVVQQGFTGTIPNTANATYTFGPNGGVNSNTTYVSVVTQQPTPATTGTVVVCGLVTAYMPPSASGNGSVTIGGLLIPLANGAGSAYFAVTSPATNLCAQFTITNGVATATSVGQNLAVQSVVCGVYTASSVASQVYLGGLPVNYVTGTSTSMLVSGGYYCAVLNSSGQANAFLTAIPTAITHAPSASGAAHVGRFMLEE